MGYADPGAELRGPHGVSRGGPVPGDRQAASITGWRWAARGCFRTAAKFIQIDIHEEELGLNRQLDAAICADAGAALRELLRSGGRRAMAGAAVAGTRARAPRRSD